MIALVLGLAYAGPKDDLVRPDILPSWATETRSVSDSTAAETWWVTFADPGFVAVMERALAVNSDLRSVYHRSEAASSASKQALSPLLPTLTFDANASISPTASRGFQFGGFGSVPGAPEPPKTYLTGSAAFNAGWDIDLFYRNGMNARASHHDAMAAEGDRDAAILALAARVAEGYFDVVAARERVEIVQRQSDASAKLLEIVELRYQAGDASAVDLLQQRQQAAATRSQLPIAKAGLRSLEFQLAVALSLPPSTVVKGIAQTLPALPPIPDTGVPGDLILNRPDLRAAESRLDASTARKHTAVRQLLPTLRLNGQAGWQYFDETEFISQSFWTAGASVSVPLFQGGRTHFGMQSAKSTENAAVHAYTQLAANAVLEVENALVLEAYRGEQLAAVTAQEEAARLAWTEAQDQYVNGVGHYLALLTAQTTHQNAELALLDSRRQLLSARISLHDALGGQWAGALADTLGDK